MKIDIVVVYVARYVRGHERHFVPPITGIHLAAITPAGHEVRVVHQQVEPVPLDTDADLVALSFFSGFAPEAYRLVLVLVLVLGNPPRAGLRARRAPRAAPSETHGDAAAIRQGSRVVCPGRAVPAWRRASRDADS